MCAKSKKINSFAKLLRLDMDANQTADIHRSIISSNNTNFLVSCESTVKIYKYFCKQTTKPTAGTTESATVYYSASESEITLIFLRPLMFRDTISSHIFSILFSWKIIATPLTWTSFCRDCKDLLLPQLNTSYVSFSGCGTDPFSHHKLPNLHLQLYARRHCLDSPHLPTPNFNDNG